MTIWHLSYLDMTWKVITHKKERTDVISEGVDQMRELPRNELRVKDVL